LSSAKPVTVSNLIDFTLKGSIVVKNEYLPLERGREDWFIRRQGE
jgi:hypothetical protein